MPKPLHVSTESAFLLSGVFIMLVAWVLNLMGTLSSEPGSGHGVSDVYLWLMLMFQGLAFSTVGVVSSKYHEFSVNPNLAKRYLVGFLFIADGGLHLLALNQHLSEPSAAAFFALVAPIQIIVGVVFPSMRGGLDPAWLLFTAFLVGAYLATRTIAIWPIGYVEEFDPLGVLSKAVELLTVGVLLSLVRSERVAKREGQPLAPTHGP